MRITVLTMFPAIFSGWLEESLVRSSTDRRLFSFDAIDLKQFSGREDGRIDDRPFGGGPGMVYRPDPVLDALESIDGWEDMRRIHFTPAGTTWTQSAAVGAAADDRPVILLCSRYEGVDQRAIELGGFEEVSLGDWVVMGGEVPAMAWIESVLRLRPGVLGDAASAVEDSFSDNRDGLLDCPHYTRPADFRGRNVPDVLLSGDHARIEAWRRERSVERTRDRRPDLIGKSPHGT